MTTLITGAVPSLCLETARHLAAQGARVILGTPDPDSGQDAVVELRWDGGTAEAIPLDPASEDSVREAAAEITRRHGRLDLLVNHCTLPATLPLEQLLETLEEEVSGTRRLLRHFLPLLRRSPGGRVIQIPATTGPATGNP